MVPIYGFLLIVVTAFLLEVHIGLGIFVGFLGLLGLVELNEKEKTRWIDVFTGIGVLSVLVTIAMIPVVAIIQFIF